MSGSTFVDRLAGKGQPPPEAETLDRFTDAVVAAHFARRHGHQVRFDHRRGRWLLWQDHRFAPETDGEITRLALAFAAHCQQEALALADRDARVKTVTAAIRLEKRDALSNMLALARDLKPIADAGDQWDRQSYLLGVPNGVVDLQTGTLRAGRHEDRITMHAGVPFDPAATCARFERFVLEVSGGDPVLAAYHQRLAGYCLTGSIAEHAVHIWNGTGANGKTTFTKILLAVWGDYADAAPFSTFERTANRSAIPNDLAALDRKRLIVASETREGARFDEGRMKSLSGGDRMRARFLNQEYFSFEPTCKLVLCVNHRPVVNDDSRGFWRRMRIVPFSATFDPDPTLDDVLRAEAAGILAWAVRGCLAWQRDSLRSPASVTTATEEYKTESDALADFIDEACDSDPYSEVRASELYDHYKQWADRRGLGERERLTATMFGRKLSERFRKVHTRDGNVYIGLARHLG